MKKLKEAPRDKPHDIDVTVLYFVLHKAQKAKIKLNKNV